MALRTRMRRYYYVREKERSSRIVKADAINREDFPDLEDCLQVQCARKIQADYIVTRNVNDFAHSKIEAATPKEFIKKMENIW